VIEPGDFKVYISGSLPSELSQRLGAATPASGVFNVK